MTSTPLQSDRDSTASETDVDALPVSTDDAVTVYGNYADTPADPAARPFRPDEAAVYRL